MLKSEKKAYAGTEVCIFSRLLFQPLKIIFRKMASWWQRSGSTLDHIMTCCLTALSHYLNQCWLLIGEVLWYSSESNVTANDLAIFLYPGFGNYAFQITVTSPRDQCVNANLNLSEFGLSYDLFQGDCRTYSYVAALSCDGHPNWENLNLLSKIIPRTCHNINR